MRKDAPLAVDMPGPDRDSPGWIKVGVIAAVGFVLGVAWPRVMGIRLGPSAPSETSAAAASGSAKSGARAPEAPAASVSGKTPVQPAASVTAPAASVSSVAAATAVPTAAAGTQISVQKGKVLSCKTEGGDTKKGQDCGAVAGLDQLVAPRLRKLSTCSAADGQSGKLSLVVTADFAGGKMNWDIGKSTNVGNIDGIGGCLKTLFQGTGVSGVAHEHARYTVAYSATLAPSTGASSLDKGDKDPIGARVDKNAKARSGEDAPDDSKDRPEPAPVAGGEASVGWEVALVRDVPKTGQVVARLPRGTKVKVGNVKDGWFSIKYGDGFASDGWVYRGAINR
ncbi:hypothetical protein AKJ09_04737 [Labilithrix luteola]|uniref:SH3b domain-containing protein n=1 Tax=Labilithrix luteola TaxID=1391654 RepID=A0A0K1PX20_9BACT|nr:hypothetical protein [Labilithrix luteola]AKU98073.1 hypothetical protein AKJ09_04737 [Labilithrix luteola]